MGSIRVFLGHSAIAENRHLPGRFELGSSLNSPPPCANHSVTVHADMYAGEATTFLTFLNLFTFHSCLHHSVSPSLVLKI